MKGNDDSDEHSHTSSDEDEALWNDLKPVEEKRMKRKANGVRDQRTSNCTTQNLRA